MSVYVVSGFSRTSRGPAEGGHYARSPKQGIVLRNGEHAVEGNPRPVLLVVRHDDSIVHLTGDEPFEDPQQMVGRHAEHRRAETAELIDGVHGAIGLYLIGKTIDEVDLGTDAPD